MEYRNNWPTYLQEKKSPAKGLAESGSSGVCVGKANKTEFDFGLVEFKTKAEIIKKKAVEKSSRSIDQIMRQLIELQKSADVTYSCRARKAAIELASERRRLSSTCNYLQYEVSKKRLTPVEFKRRMSVENRKAISLFLARWSYLF